MHACKDIECKDFNEQMLPLVANTVVFREIKALFIYSIIKEISFDYYISILNSLIK